MLFFIKGGCGVSAGSTDFNTSNVIFYRRIAEELEEAYQFQYIQCYFLSASYLRLAISSVDFNTSNVIFYHTKATAVHHVNYDFNTSNVIFYPG